MNKSMIRLIILISTFFLSLSSYAKPEGKVSSPDGQLTLTAGVKGGTAYYTLRRGSEAVVNVSNLGFQLNDGALNGDFRVVKFTRDTKDETWTQPWGEEKDIRNHYNELTMRLQEQHGKKRLLNVVFRVFDDGIGFRYEFPQQPNLKDFQIMDELTEFNLPWDAEAWTQPTNGTVYYEAVYTKEPVS